MKRLALPMACLLMAGCAGPYNTGIRVARFDVVRKAETRTARRFVEVRRVRPMTRTELIRLLSRSPDDTEEVEGVVARQKGVQPAAFWAGAVKLYDTAAYALWGLDWAEGIVATPNEPIVSAGKTKALVLNTPCAAIGMYGGPLLDAQELNSLVLNFRSPDLLAPGAAGDEALLCYGYMTIPPTVGSPAAPCLLTVGLQHLSGKDLADVVVRVDGTPVSFSPTGSGLVALVEFCAGEHTYSVWSADGTAVYRLLSVKLTKL